MTDNEHEVVELVTEKFERRLAEEMGKVRVEMANGFGGIRAEMIERNAELLKWGLIFAVGQTAAVTGVVALFR